MISVVFPAYNEEDSVTDLHARIKSALDSSGEPYEIIAVENGSLDHTLETLRKLRPLKIVVIAKNIGQTAGLDAGLKAAKGEVVVTLDADLQNDPKDIPALVKKIREGYDVVSGWRRKRNDPLNRRVLSRLANWFTWKVTGLYLHDHACALKAYRQSVLRSVHLYGEMHVFLPAYLHSRGAKVTEMEVTHHERTKGISKHNFLKAVKDLSDLFTIKFMGISRPLLFFGGWATLSWFLGFLAIAVSVILKIQGTHNFGQTPLPIIAALFIILGFLLLMMGFLAELILRTYYEAKKETPYIVKEVIENK